MPPTNPTPPTPPTTSRPIRFSDLKKGQWFFACGEIWQKTDGDNAKQEVNAAHVDDEGKEKEERLGQYFFPQAVVERADTPVKPFEKPAEMELDTAGSDLDR